MCKRNELKDLTENGDSKSEKEREIYLVQKIILAIENLASNTAKQGTEDVNDKKPSKAKGDGKKSKAKVSQRSAGADDVHFRGGGEDKQPLLDSTDEPA